MKKGIGTKAKLARVNVMIKEFERIVKDYPLNAAYKESLAKLERERVNIIDRIGRK